MYIKGDKVVYGNIGVCEIIDIEKGPDGMDYYSLKPKYDRCMIYAPVEGKVFIRPVITKEEALALIGSIPCIEAEPYYNNRIQELSSHYKQMIEMHDNTKLIELVISIHKKKEAALKLNRKLGQVDERFLRQSEELLYGELSSALDEDKDAVAERIRGIIAENID